MPQKANSGHPRPVTTGAAMDVLDLATTASESYSDWENIAVAVLFVLIMAWLILGLPGVPRAWLSDGWRESKSPQGYRQGPK